MRGVFIVFFIIFILFSKMLDLFYLTEEEIDILGFSSSSLKFFFLFLASIFVAILISFSGIIGFVGLIVPHIVKTFNHSSHFYKIILSFFIGGIFL